MKGAKGGKRDRIISFLFSKKNQEEKLQEEELAQNELLKQKEKIDKEKKLFDNDDGISFTSSKSAISDNTQSAELSEPVKDQVTSSTFSQTEDTTLIEKSEPSNEKHTESTTISTFDTPVMDMSEPSNEKHVENTKTSTFDVPIMDKSEPSNEKKNPKPFVTTTYTSVDSLSEPVNKKTPLENQELVSEMPVVSNSVSSVSGSHSGNRPSNTEEHEITITEEIVKKEETEELFLEKSIISSLERMIKEDLYELEQIQYELEVLSEKEDEEVLKEEVEKLRQRLDALIQKFEKLKSIYYSSEELGNFKIDNDLLYDSILDYKEEYKNNNLVEIAQAEISAIESYVSLLDQISLIETFKDDLDQKIDDKLARFEIRDEQFEEMKLNYENVEEITNTIDKFNEQQEALLKDMEEKLANSEKITHEVQRTVELVPHYERLFAAALMISASKRIPPTPHGNMLKAGLMINAISNAAHFLQVEEHTKEVTKIKYSDYSADFKNIRSEIAGVLDQMENAFDDLDAIREKFKKDCGEYASQIKEYDEFMKNLDKIEADLKLKQSIAKKYDKDFEKMLQKNDAKVKRLGALENTEAV